MDMYEFGIESYVNPKIFWSHQKILRSKLIGTVPIILKSGWKKKLLTEKRIVYITKYIYKKNKKIKKKNTFSNNRLK